MYRVLYRKWRPQVFDDVVGQPHITSTLSAEVREDRLSHAYLFTGSRGTGKTTCAKILAKAVNCLSPVNGNPCNKCAICRGIDDGTVLDVTEMDAASNRGIDDIRALRDEVNFTPSAAKYRVYIVDEVHMLSPDASNALLKTLEEPPAHVIFILATTEINKILPTILSRCQRFDFRRIEPKVIADRLTYVAGEEGSELDPEAAMLIARLSDGGMRDALSLLDACISVNGHVTTEVVFSCAGLVGREQIYTLVEAIGHADASAALRTLDALHAASCDTGRLLSELTDRYRSFLILKTVKKPGDLIVGTEEELERLKKLSALFTKEQVLYALNILTATAAAARSSQNRRVEAEMAVIRLCSPENDDSVSALQARISKLEALVERLSVGGLPPVTAAQSVAPQRESDRTDVPPQSEKPATQPETPAPPTIPFTPEPAPDPGSAAPQPAGPDFTGFGNEAAAPAFTFDPEETDDAPLDESALPFGDDPGPLPEASLFDVPLDGPPPTEEEMVLTPPEEPADEGLPFGEDHSAAPSAPRDPNAPDPNFDVDSFLSRYSGKSIEEVNRRDEETKREHPETLTFRVWAQIVLAIEQTHHDMIGRFTDSSACIRGDRLLIRPNSPMIKLVTPQAQLDSYVAPIVAQQLGRQLRVEFE